MNIQSIAMEELCNNLKNDFSQYFDWNDMGINYSRINLSDKSVNVLSSDYDWLLTFWGDDMDLRIGERLSAGIQYWRMSTERFYGKGKIVSLKWISVRSTAIHLRLCPSIQEKNYLSRI
ncbi:hypothetical protein [Morganella morganii]|uniref:hypothetical protein n=1 Tax=Morganella morganii TaxID=582 RepID=UPI000B08A5BA